MAVAARLFFEQGYANTTIDQIAAELGVSKPFVYYYFRDKLTLLETLSWGPTAEALSSMDFPADDPRPAHAKLAAGLERLVRVTVEHHPAATLPYRELQVYGPAYRSAHQRMADRFYDRMTALLEQARAEGRAAFDDAKVTALAAASIAGFLYTWYRPEGRLPRDEVIAQLTRIAMRAIGLRRRAGPAVPEPRSARSKASR
jgi:AcrR family transcriptional regulator